MLTAPLLLMMVLDMSSKTSNLDARDGQSMAPTRARYTVVLWAGWPFFQRGWASIVNRHLNMFTLIALGTGASYLFSVIAVLFPSIIPASFRHHMAEVPLYFEPAAVITALVLLGQVLELRARSQTSSALKSLLGLAPKTAESLMTPVGNATFRLTRSALEICCVSPWRESARRWRRSGRYQLGR